MKETELLLRKGNVWEAVPFLRDSLRSKKLAMSNDEWNEYCNALQQDTSLAGLVYRCPYTLRARNKPRGYAGDAVMMDYIYGFYDKTLLSSTDDLGEELFRFTTNSAAARAVRHRRRLLADAIDNICGLYDSASILSVACGHFREAELSKCIKSNRPASVSVLDQDEESLATVRRDYGEFGISALNGSVRDILSSKVILNAYHLIYSAGLYDYLNDRLAERLTSKLVEHLHPQGRILLANFTPEHQDVGFMEAIMDWKLIYRTPDDMRRLLMNVGCSSVEISSDPTGSIVYASGTL